MKLLGVEDLRVLALGPTERLRAAVAGEIPDDPSDVVVRFTRGVRRFIDGFETWSALLRDFTAGSAGTLASDKQATTAGPDRPTDSGTDRLGETEQVRVLQAIEDGAVETAYVAFAELQQALRARHAVGRDRVTSSLSALYSQRGIAALEASLRYVGDRTLLRWMPQDIRRDPRSRLATWAGMLTGNFATLTIEETDDHFVLLQSPCGTCGSQVAAGRYEGPKAFAVVDEPHPVTFGRGDTPIYRTHVAVMHGLMPMERIGVPWPVVQCPRGLQPGPCRILLYKDPFDRAALDQVNDR